METRFVVLADNDDFFIVSGLNQSVEFLQSHPDYSACRGEVGAFLVSGSQIYDAVDGVYGDHVEFVPGVYHNQSLEQDSARERLGSHFLKYGPTWYEVHRTDQLREAFRVLRSLEISDLYLAELLISGFTVIAGKVKREPDPYLFRQSQTPDSGFTRKHDGFDRMLLETWSADFKKFVEAMANALASADRSSADEAREFVREIYRSYIGSSMIPRFSGGGFDEAALSDEDTPTPKGSPRAEAFGARDDPTRTPVERPSQPTRPVPGRSAPPPLPMTLLEGVEDTTPSGPPPGVARTPEPPAPAAAKPEPPRAEPKSRNGSQPKAKSARPPRPPPDPPLRIEDQKTQVRTAPPKPLYGGRMQVNKPTLVGADPLPPDESTNSTLTRRARWIRRGAYGVIAASPIACPCQAVMKPQDE